MIKRITNSRAIIIVESFQDICSLFNESVKKGAPAASNGVYVVNTSKYSTFFFDGQFHEIKNECMRDAKRINEYSRLESSKARRGRFRSKVLNSLYKALDE